MNPSGEVMNVGAGLSSPAAALPSRDTIRPARLGAVATPLQVERIASIDLLRIVAATGIVWFHMIEIPHRWIGYAGLPVFLLIFHSLIVRLEPARSVWDFTKRRAARLLKPWLFWSVVYGLCKSAKAAYAMDFGQFRKMFADGTLLCGTSVHLWYLPFAFVSGCLVYQTRRWSSGFSATTTIWVATSIGILILIGYEITGIGDHLIRPLPQYKFALATIPLGFAIGHCLTIPRRRTQRLLLAAVGSAVATACVALHSQNLSALSLPYGLAVVLVCFAYSWHGTGNAFVAAVAPLSFGVYLLHPLVAYGLKLFLSPARHHIAFVLLTVCVSCLITWGLAQTPLRKLVQ